MRKEIAPSEYKVYYSRAAKAYYVTIMDRSYYFHTRKEAQAFTDRKEAELLNG